MPEISHPIERKYIIYEVIYVCDTCEVGHMWSNNVMLTVDPPLFPHECDKCGAKANYHQQYPGMSYG